MSQATTRPWNRLDGIFAAILQRPLARRLARDARFTIPVCIILICGCFTAAGLLQMRLDRSHALAQAETFETARVQSVAQSTGQTLDRYARLGAVFAASPQQYRSADLGRAEPAIRDIAVWDGRGNRQARLQADTNAPFPQPQFAGPRTSFPGGLAIRDGGQTIAVLFDPKSIALGSHRTALISLKELRGSGGSISATVPGWPLAVMTSVDEKNVLADWAQTLPLYLFVILGPALVGGWLAALFVGAFERHARASRAIRALKSTRPIEAKLMVRLANAERGAMEALRSKSEFIAHMSHELRTPLNAVIGFSEIIAQEFYGPAGHPKYGEYARDIGDAGRNLHAKIGDILEFANIEAGRHPLSEEAVDLAALAQSCVEEQEGRAFSRRISLSLAFGEPGQVRADSRAVRRILTNLLANALAYTAEGGIVRVDVHFDEGAGIVTLSDSGMGFTRGEAAIAGKPFQRFDRTGTVTGAGLGLAIAMELARRMGGTMQLAGGGHGGGETGRDVVRGAVMELRLPRL
ncbi:MAG TPA: HAMP domain-containing sensor histidine kinase [Rhizomicrobium sp.]|nr:HAMP domain-containing sensor histidine kinase [Rhizomicrobium sp.]